VLRFIPNGSMGAPRPDERSNSTGRQTSNEDTRVEGRCPVFFRLGSATPLGVVVFRSSGWAGFWEQWLVAEMTLRWPELVAEASAEWRQVLSVLPLLAEAPYRAVRDRVALPVPQSVVREFFDPRRPGSPPPAPRR
jgi:hypothetical protein